MLDLRLALCAVCWLVAQSLCAQERLSDYQEFYQGDLPIILEVAHGGRKYIPSITPNPHIGKYDKLVLEFTRLVRQRMIERTGRSPEMVAILADPAFVNVNQPPGTNAYRHAFTKELYEAHYRAIDAAIGRVAKRHGTGLMVSMHSGISYPVDLAIGVNRAERWCTIPKFVERHGWQTFHGEDGIGGHLFLKGYQVPGFGNTPPGNDFTGVPATSRCRKRNNIGVDGMQFEFNGGKFFLDIRRRQKLANDVADTLLGFVEKYYAKAPLKN